ncbi:unnamed protein product [Adineta ricciae]|uniref:Uncharacterized protein n=1 Tax=Adineta ricciae TaxID=249248 RepID=A0A815KXA7_ADIRI|nr:unnamed protein product [Adineta ricciae]CAF1401565.1 unnamed protein product [Adineta ricciae]
MTKETSEINSRWYFNKFKSVRNPKGIAEKKNKTLLVQHPNSAKSSKTNTNSEDFLSTSSHSLTTTVLLKDLKENVSSRRTSFTTTSTNNDQRCQRSFSSNSNAIERETCSVLGPEICTDCLQIQTRSQLSPQVLSRNQLNQQLKVLALRRFIQNSSKLSDEDLIKMINENQIKFQEKYSNEIEKKILTDDQYFDDLANLLNRYSNYSSPYYFTNLKDFQRKYQSNKYQRLYLHETPSPISSNPLFNHKSLEKFDISKKYSFMKKASTIKPNVKSSIPIFISSEQKDPLHLKYRSLQDYSPNLHIYQKTEQISTEKSLIGTKYLQ